MQYLFHNDGVVSLMPGWILDRDAPSLFDSKPDCDQFRQHYVGNGVINFSQIGVSADNRQALIFMQHKCGHSPKPDSYFLLTQSEGEWQIDQKIAQSP
ncbi:MAG: hypothetical protein GY943_30250 [Chloroflexi bacterium]|nr:hypothetical protein [Chloroflexota bacterium]